MEINRQFVPDRPIRDRVYFCNPGLVRVKHLANAIGSHNIRTDRKARFMGWSIL
jgi:hypothetical protein